MNVLVTGVAGFIGYFIANKLLKAGHSVYGIDNLNDYYDTSLKKDRLEQLLPHASFTFNQLDLADRRGMEDLFQQQSFDRVIHLAAQAGVRYSLKNPHAYADSNLIGFVNILEGCRHSKVAHLVYASSSSVYGANRTTPFSVTDNVDHPVSLYAATKKANELMAHSYSHLYDLPTTGLRFFTVYGPWGRPDMAYFKFVDAIANNRPIQVYNHGKMQRDFTYIDDVVEGIVRVMDHLPSPLADEEFNTAAPYKVYNIGNHNPVSLMHFIEVIEKVLGQVAVKEMMPMQPGDVTTTYADVAELTADVGFAPNTPLEEGIKNFVTWYKDYYQ
ncbi:NAD-dependent epimerase [Leptolyngbyaceae cyanobacterium CCMR0082]|uniref:NAD-dependent epimerase n=2 Tax=Adonisia turfae TaxID=2950184 RepID=A0A6M0S2Y1_9CYAN|nr:NAD-dependent epimerase [Adonisia turfae]MDV3347650.1 NAD-dependent epimerase [Leptothoe sp. LEGE 181152]NEZ55796.1 NAD-dependent epimerase [Adonisia turfae CCMR0081]NEZ62331.1 NAD-dependent epimerase [Adonisia turfae CCMR0082]